MKIGHQATLRSPERCGVLDGVDTRGYDGVWRLWKLSSLGLFAVFVGCAVDIAISMRRHSGRTVRLGFDRGRGGRPVEEVADARLGVSANVVRADLRASDPSASFITSEPAA